jgi:hypothetical protein
MPTKTYWAGQYLLAAASMFALIAVIDVVRGDSLAATWPETLAWSALAAAIFIGSRYRQLRRAEDCALCKDDKPRR